MWSIKQLFCKHEYDFLMNIYGDAIIHSGWKRSIWRCAKCNKLHYHNRLNYDYHGTWRALGYADKT